MSTDPLDPTRGAFGSAPRPAAPLPAPPFLQRARKFVAALVGVLVQVLALNVLPDEWHPWATVVVAVLTAFSVYGLPNAQPADPDAPVVPGTTRYTPGV